MLGGIPKPGVTQREKKKEERKEKGLTGEGFLIVLPHGNKVP